MDDKDKQIEELGAILNDFVMLAMQSNHFGRNDNCPTCQIVKTAVPYFQKYYPEEKAIAEGGEEIRKLIEDVKKDPHKAILSLPFKGN